MYRVNPRYREEADMIKEMIMIYEGKAMKEEIYLVEQISKSWVKQYSVHCDRTNKFEEGTIR